MNDDRTFAPGFATVLTLIAAASVSWLLAFQIDGVAGNFASIILLRRENEGLSRMGIAICLCLPLIACYWQFYRNERWKPLIWGIVTIPGSVIGAVFCLPVIWIWPLLSNEPPPGWFMGWLLSLGLTLVISSWMACRRPGRSIVVAGIPLLFVLLGAITDYGTVKEYREYGQIALLSVTQMVLSATVWVGTRGAGFTSSNRFTKMRIPFLEKSFSGENTSLGRARTVAFIGAGVLAVAQSYMAILIVVVGILAFDNPERAQWLAKASVTLGSILAIFAFFSGVEGSLGYLRLTLMVVVPVVVHRQLKLVDPSDVQPIDNREAHRAHQASTALRNRQRHVDDLYR